MFKVLFLLLFFLTHLFGRNYTVRDSFLILPNSSNVEMRWIFLPDMQQETQFKLSKDTQFVINSEGEPLLVFEGVLLINPIKKYLLKLDRPVRDMIGLENGVLLFSDGRSLGFIKIEKSFGLLPEGRFVPVAQLPLENMKLFKGEDSVYACSFNPNTKTYEVYLFDPKSNSFKKILSLPEKVTSVSGVGNHVFLSLGKRVLEYKNGQQKIIYEHPKEEIQAIYYSDKAGLFYKTASGVGIISLNTAFEFLKAKDIFVFSKGKSIFILFATDMKILELRNLDELNGKKYQIERVINVE